MILCQDIKIGTCINLEGQLYFCIDFLHVKPGKGNTFVRTKLKNVVNGRVLERTFQIGFKILSSFKREDRIALEVLAGEKGLILPLRLWWEDLVFLEFQQEA